MVVALRTAYGRVVFGSFFHKKEPERMNTVLKYSDQSI
ncbi:MAG: hypothetical protein ACI94Y_004417 [Maribacter sp.]